MNRHVIILAQGQQTRLPELKVPKQLIELCPGGTIIGRTVQQVKAIDRDVLLTVVCRDEVVWGPTHSGADPLALLPLLWRIAVDPDRTRWWQIVTLPQPGNSSLKGLVQVLDKCATEVSAIFPGTGRGDADQTVILLGDTVYSWDCIKTLFWTSNLREPTGDPGPDLTFVTTSDLSPSGGEVWGLSWPADRYLEMRHALHAALGDHPPFTAYQPGQLRRMIKHSTNHQIIHVDDYTRDIDIPEHLLLLPDLAQKARADDAAHGVEW